MNLFKWIDELFVGKRDWNTFSDADKKKFSPFMVNRYLSMQEDFLPFVNYFQKYTIEVMPHKSVYQFYCNLLPKKKTYLKYLSGKKEKTNDMVVPFIMEYFEVSKLQASEYYKLMSKEDLILLVKKFGKSDKEIKKMKIR
tara:strand:+ start:3346 stop:3765 length:420 start_codon:yes stop_codon:yes gene_type:complete